MGWSGVKVRDFLGATPHKVLSEEDNALCDSEINVKEKGEALQLLYKNSAIGPDGLSSDFYKTFWRFLKDPSLKSLNQSVDKGKVSTSERRGIITLIHKGKNARKKKYKT
ncbi:tyrosyl-DNA phosphodiesterase 2 [Elysia marginata]|uniref:Tyrosyl-DNA phosphodiesterase 2 n=1 Tax=Elysia marginata TaxID=1093978 RepID=A0AAV4HQP5_9GAST|nr:tyrosyl-DNA phosphodiesterase 2 [Elysia marginata]